MVVALWMCGGGGGVGDWWWLCCGGDGKAAAVKVLSYLFRKIPLLNHEEHIDRLHLETRAQEFILIKHTR